MTNPINNLPGLQAKRTSLHRVILRSDKGVKYHSAGKIVDGALSRDPLNTGDLDVLRAGLLMGKITASSKYAPSIIGTLLNAHTSDSATTITVSAATAVELVRRIGSSGVFDITGPPTANGVVATEEYTYSAVNVTTGVITISTDATDYVAGSWIQPTDGSETIVTVIGDGHGIKVTDQDDLDIDVDFSHSGGGQAMLIGGEVDSSQILNYGTDTSLQNRIQTQLNAVGHFWFDDDF